MELTGQKISYPFFTFLVKEIFRGKSLARSLLNYNLKNIVLKGEVLDLGSKSNKASYNRFLQKDVECNITFTDWHESGDNILKLNLEEKFSIEDSIYDFITCFNTLEHIYNFKNAVSESCRILKSGGIFIGQTPFLVNYHADPNDYFRYTHQAIEKIFAEAGFVCERIIYLGFGPLSASFAMKYHICPKFLRPIFLIGSILLDNIIMKYKKSQRLRYPLGYLYIMKKR